MVAEKQIGIVRLDGNDTHSHSARRATATVHNTCTELGTRSSNGRPAHSLTRAAQLAAKPFATVIRRISSHAPLVGRNDPRIFVHARIRRPHAKVFLQSLLGWRQQRRCGRLFARHGHWLPRLGKVAADNPFQLRQRLVERGLQPSVADFVAQ